MTNGIGKTSLQDCLCDAGYTPNSNNPSLSCVQCITGKYTNVTGDYACIDCQSSKYSEIGATVCVTPSENNNECKQSQFWCLRFSWDYQPSDCHCCQQEYKCYRGFVVVLKGLNKYFLDTR